MTKPLLEFSPTTHRLPEKTPAAAFMGRAKKKTTASLYDLCVMKKKTPESTFEVAVVAVFSNNS